MARSSSHCDLPPTCPIPCTFYAQAAVEPFMPRCFPGVKKLGVSREWGVRIEALVSPEGERLLLRQPVDLMVGTCFCIQVHTHSLSQVK